MAQANTSIDWEQRRYEVAKDVFVSAFAYRAPGTDMKDNGTCGLSCRVSKSEFEIEYL